MAKLPFFTRYEYGNTIPVSTGTEFDKTYQVKVDKLGHKSLVCTGKTNRFETIQQYKDECLIENILIRATTDPSVLNARVGSYFDASEMPKTLAEFQQMYIDTVNEFNKLPLETRKLFNNSPEQYVAELGTEECAKKLGLIKDVVEHVEEVKEVVDNAE